MMFTRGPPKTCSFVECCHDSTEINSNVRYMEVCAAIPEHCSASVSALKVRWDGDGNARFHVECWEAVLKAARARKRKSKSLAMVASEQTMVRQASKTVEMHDGIDEVKQEAIRAAEMIKSSKHCVAFTGAGISTSAGIGDFRGKCGKWTEEERQLDAANAASSDDPVAKKPRAASSEESDAEKPHPDSASDNDKDQDEDVNYEQLRPTFTHEALVKLIDLGYLKFIISQNGDGLHPLSGVAKDNIAELHGNVFVEKCEKCGHRYHRHDYVLDDEGSCYYEEMLDNGETHLSRPRHALQCSQCKLSHRTGKKCERKGCTGYLMDTIINFGDDLEESVLSRATQEAEACDLMVCLGSTLTVTPARDLATMGKTPPELIICNRQKTHLDKECGRLQLGGVGGGTRCRQGPGARVFGDCDLFMREVMKCILTEDDLKQWIQGKAKRMRTYDEKRKGAL